MEREKQEINTREKAQSKVLFFVLSFILIFKAVLIPLVVLLSCR
jgi:hypothetical protein